MEKMKRFDVFFEKFIGFGIRWCTYFYQLDISISLPFVTFCVGIGKYKLPDFDEPET